MSVVRHGSVGVAGGVLMLVYVRCPSLTASLIGRVPGRHVGGPRKSQGQLWQECPTLDPW